MENKGFLTPEEAKEQADFCWDYGEGVYVYAIQGKGSTLVEDGKVLVDGADWVYCYPKGVYDYEIEGGDWVEINNK
tara:strand:+ start:451 stop:678 length:228 start_codon:yes stop_codon:yes gene_type:complete